MAVKVVNNLVSKSKYGLKCPNPMKAEYITIHNTANDASAANEISYMKNNSSSTSFHFAVDDKQVIQGIPTNRNAWHTGDGTNGTGNRKSIGVEIFIASREGHDTRQRKNSQLSLWRSYLKNADGVLIESANIKTGMVSIARTVFCQREDGIKLRLPLKKN